MLSIFCRRSLGLSGLPFARASIGTSAGGDFSTSRSETGFKEEITVEYTCPKIGLLLNSQWTTLSDHCREDLKALRESRRMEDLDAFFRKYGNIIIEEVTFGGLLRWSQAANRVSGCSSQEKEAKLKAFVDAKFFSANGKGSYTSTEESANYQVSRNWEQTLYFRRLGGCQSKAAEFHSKDEVDDWWKSLDSPDLWDIIERLQPERIETVIAKMDGMRWVAQLFEEIRIHTTVTPPPPAHKSEIYSENTSLAFIQLDWDGIADPDGWIRFGVFDNGQIDCHHSTEILFKDRIVQGRKDTPLAAHAPEKRTYYYRRPYYESIHLFYLNNDSEVCQHIFDLDEYRWRAGNLQAICTGPSSGFNLDLRVGDDEENFILSYEEQSGQIQHFKYEQATWISLQNESARSQQTTNLESALDPDGGPYPIPGSFPGTETRRYSFRASRIRRARSCYPAVKSPEHALFEAALSQQDEITVTVHSWSETNASIERDDDSNSSTNGNEDANFGPGIYSNLCFVRPGSDYCAIVAQEDYDKAMPGFIFISREGRMRMMRIDLSQIPGGYNFLSRSIFGQDCVKRYAGAYFRAINLGINRALLGGGDE